MINMCCQKAVSWPSLAADAEACVGFVSSIFTLQSDVWWCECRLQGFFSYSGLPGGLMMALKSPKAWYYHHHVSPLLLPLNGWVIVWSENKTPWGVWLVCVQLEDSGFVGEAVLCHSWLKASVQLVWIILSKHPNQLDLFPSILFQRSWHIWIPSTVVGTDNIGSCSAAVSSVSYFWVLVDLWVRQMLLMLTERSFTHHHQSEVNRPLSVNINNPSVHRMYIFDLYV